MAALTLALVAGGPARADEPDPALRLPGQLNLVPLARPAAGLDLTTPLAVPPAVPPPPAYMDTDVHVVLKCKIAEDRRLVNCAVISVTPPIAGFDAAGLKMSELMHIKPGPGAETGADFTLRLKFKPPTD